MLVLLTHWRLAAINDRDKNESLEELIEAEQITLLGRAKRWLYVRLSDYPFMTVLILSALPNPLFSLIEIACGYFKVSFTNFFIPNVLGKIIKTSIKVFFVWVY
jgi:membrane protein YqaA with SNARE-associated domain